MKLYGSPEKEVEQVWYPFLDGEDKGSGRLNSTPEITRLKGQQWQAHVCLSLRPYVIVLLVALPAIDGLPGIGIARVPMSITLAKNMNDVLCG